jgi:MFS family permease
MHAGLSPARPATERILMHNLSWWLAPFLIAAILAVVVGVLRTERVRRIYESHFQESRRERLFLSSVGFVVTVAVVRALTWAIHNGIGPFQDVAMHGRHIHHLVWGITLLLLVGYLWMLEVGTGSNQSLVLLGRLTSLLYGVGSALTLDEFALWLNLRDVYWEREGRESLEALALFAGAMAVGIFGAGFFQALVRHLGPRK